MPSWPCLQHTWTSKGLSWIRIEGARSVFPTCIQLRLNDMQGYIPRVCFPSDASQVADTSACRFVRSVLFELVHPEGAQFWPSTRKSGSHSPSWSLQECWSSLGTLKQMARPLLQQWAGTQEGRVVLKQDAGWITLHSWRGWSPKVRAAFNGVAAWEETASEGAFIMLRLWINSACCTLGSQALLIKNVNKENRVRKRTILQLNFLYWMNRGPPPPPFFWFQTKGFASSVGLFAAWKEHSRL